MYADDTHLTFPIKDITALDQALNRDVDSVNNWLVSNKLTLNAANTEFTVILYQDLRISQLEFAELLLIKYLQNPKAAI